MNIFMLRSKPHNMQRMDVFLKDNVVAIGWTATGPLTNAAKEEIRDILQSLGYEGQSLSTNLGMVNSFVHVMKEKDLVLIRQGDTVHLGEVGHYKWEDKYKDIQMAHTRSVQWISTVPFEELNASVQSLLKNIKTIARYPGTLQESGLEKYLSVKKEPADTPDGIKNKEDLLSNTIDILKDLANNADDEKVRLEAAKELLSYLKNT